MAPTMPHSYKIPHTKLLNAEVHTTQELNLLVILPDLSCERPRVRRHLNVTLPFAVVPALHSVL